MEHLLGDGTYKQTVTNSEVAAILSQAETWLTAAGLIRLAEIKPGGIAIHWRGELDTEITRVEALARKGMTPFAEQPGLKLLNFDAGLELRMAHPDKGDALSAILEGLAPDTMIAFLGDDLTDEDAFRVLGDRGLSVLVRPEYRNTTAKVWLKPPHELIDFLKQWLNRISPSITDRGSS
jgi:trehalose-phosphatase